jgi:hypothetical protein
LVSSAFLVSCPVLLCLLGLLYLLDLICLVSVDLVLLVFVLLFVLAAAIAARCGCAHGRLRCRAQPSRRGVSDGRPGGTAIAAEVVVFGVVAVVAVVAIEAVVVRRTGDERR